MSSCPECGTRGYLVWPSYGNCQICLRLRIEFLEQRWSENGRSGFVEGAGDGRINTSNRHKAGPAEVLVSAGNVPATGQFEHQQASMQINAICIDPFNSNTREIA